MRERERDRERERREGKGRGRALYDTDFIKSINECYSIVTCKCK